MSMLIEAVNTQKQSHQWTKNGGGSNNGDWRSSGRSAMDELQQLHQMYESWEGDQDG